MIVLQRPSCYFSNMDTGYLIDFITLTECKSFSKAAEIMNITQPAFSRRITSLERNIGIDVVDHKCKSFRLTPAGKRFLIHAKQIVSTISEALKETRDYASHLDNPIYIVAPTLLSKTFFPAWYRTMQRNIPDLTISIIHKKDEEAINLLKKGLADFALVLHTDKVKSHYNLDGLQSINIGKDKMLAVCSKHSKNPYDFLMHNCNTYISECAEYILGKQLAKGKTVFESSSFGLLKEMALAGFGTAILLESTVDDDIAQGYLKPSFKHPSLEMEILLVRSEKSSDKRAEKLWIKNIQNKPHVKPQSVGHLEAKLHV